ncbi:MAG: helix-turn-helix transcriptional regulator [Myxococcota bacterium]
MRGSHVMLVVQVRVEPSSVGLSGFQPVLSRDFGPDAEARLTITQKWAAHEPLLHEDPILRRVVEGQGGVRVVRHRADVDATQWKDAPVRRLLEQLKLEDRVNLVVPVHSDVEVSFCIDRPLGEPVFDDVDRDMLHHVGEGLVSFAANFVRFHGLMPGQRRLDDLERHLLADLLSPATEAEMAAATGVDERTVEQRAAGVYEKLNVRSRLELFHLWKSAGADRVSREQGEALPAAPDAPLESGPLLPRVRDAIDQALNDGDVNIEAVARDLGVSVRALQRELGAAGTSFSEIAEERRKNLAMVLLALPWMGFGEVAERLNYAQVSSFNRAVARWTDRTPSQLREELLDDHRTRRQLTDKDD